MVSHPRASPHLSHNSTGGFVMLQDWEAGLVGNNPGVVARMPRKVSPARVVINLLPALVRGRRNRATVGAGLSSAA
jgi:hypothetical protein